MDDSALDSREHIAETAHVEQPVAASALVALTARDRAGAAQHVVDESVEIVS